jgi:vacuolar-type H+-ATPase subunit E/Vma4
VTIEEKIKHLQSVAMEEARMQGDEIITQHKRALEHIYESHKSEIIRQSDLRVKSETVSARQQLNTATSKGQIKLRRELSKVQISLKNQLFQEVTHKINEYMKTEEYKKLLVSYIVKAAKFADRRALTIYINKTDEDKLFYLQEHTGMSILIGKEDFIGGVRAVIPERNILIDHSFRSALEKEYEDFVFKGGATIG